MTEYKPSFEEKVKRVTSKIRNDLNLIDLHAEKIDSQYDFISSRTDLIEGYLEDIRDVIEDVIEDEEAGE